jgi:DNA-binding Lrp family transcriptional regulator
MKAYVLINTELGKESDVIEAVKDLEEITATYALYGIYDVIIEVVADTMDRIKEIVFNDIRRLDNVKSTITLITYGEGEGIQ